MPNRPPSPGPGLGTIAFCIFLLTVTVCAVIGWVAKHS